MNDEYDNSETTDLERPDAPRIDAVLIALLEKRKRKPKMFPANLLEASKYWQSIQEPPNEERERVEWQSAPKAKDGGFWRCPYIDRLKFTLQKFLILDSPRQFFVIENIEKGCVWRGDDISFFKRVIEEHEKMKKMEKDEYIASAIKQASKVGLNVNRGE